MCTELRWYAVISLAIIIRWHIISRTQTWHMMNRRKAQQDFWIIIHDSQLLLTWIYYHTTLFISKNKF
ncbi:hypothetical protein AML28_06305 [Escherichia coli]|nr:hypothetical protein AML28_06305 [Escherichia coli]